MTHSTHGALDLTPRVRLDCKHGAKGKPRRERKERTMETTPTIDQVIDAHTAVAMEYSPAAVTVSLMAPFAEMVQATRPYADGEMDGLL